MLLYTQKYKSFMSTFKLLFLITLELVSFNISMKSKHREEVSEATVDHAYWDFVHPKVIAHPYLVGIRN